jgi:hypothetical protein
MKTIEKDTQRVAKTHTGITATKDGFMKNYPFSIVFKERFKNWLKRYGHILVEFENTKKDYVLYSELCFNEIGEESSRKIRLFVNVLEPKNNNLRILISNNAANNGVGFSIDLIKALRIEDQLQTYLEDMECKSQNCKDIWKTLKEAKA